MDKLISEKLMFRPRNIARNNECCFSIIKKINSASGHNNPKWLYTYLVSEFKNRLSKTNITEKRNKSTNIVKCFNNCFSIIDRLNSQKISKDKEGEKYYQTTFYIWHKNIHRKHIFLKCTQHLEG